MIAYEGYQLQIVGARGSYQGHQKSAAIDSSDEERPLSHLGKGFARASFFYQ